MDYLFSTYPIEPEKKRGGAQQNQETDYGCLVLSEV